MSLYGFKMFHAAPFIYSWNLLDELAPFQGYVVKEEDLWSTSLKVSESWLNSQDYTTQIDTVDFCKNGVLSL